jgi:polysaccharide chain length determinant protein (PEP-CTERM system associated)
MKDQIILVISYLHGIWQYRWSALVIVWLIAIPGWIAVYAMPSQYMSYAIMHVDTKSVMQPLLKGLAVDAKVDEGLGMMTRVLLSRKNLEEVIRQTDMDLQASTPAEMDKLVNKLSKSITLKGADGNKKKRANTVYELSYQGTSPELVYQVVSKLLNTLIESTLSSARTDTAAAQVFLDEQIEEYEKRLTTSEEKLAEFKRANVGHMPDKSGGYYNRVQQQQGELDDLRSQIRLATRRLEEMNKQLKGELPLLGGGESQSMKLRQYQDQLQQLLTQFTEQHPDVVALRSTIADLLARESSGEKTYINTTPGMAAEYNPVYQNLKVEINRAKVELETMKIAYTELQRELEKLKMSADIIPEVEAKLAKLNRDYDITRERYLSLVERRESARLAQEVGQSGSNIDFKIIDPPRIATKPSGPDRLLLLSMVLFAAIGAGVAWGVFRFILKPTYIDTSQLRNNIDLPVLGSIGLHVTNEHRRRRKAQLTYFFSALSLLLVAFGLTVLFMDTGSHYFNALLASERVVL